jgi:sarcosine oxidase subunit alpha
VTRRLKKEGEPFTLELNGDPVEAFPGDTVASALIASGIDIFSRSVKYHRPRGAYCLSGRCSCCLVRVDGRPNQFACLTPASPGLRVHAQNSFPSAQHDVLASIDWMFPRGLDHHEMFAGVPIVASAMSKVARHLAGLGVLPEAVALPGPPPEERRCDVLIVGAGPAGLSCASALCGTGLAVELVDQHEEVGGRLVAGLTSATDPDLSWASDLRRHCEDSGVRLSTSATVLGIYREPGHPLAAVRRSNPDGLLLLHARVVALCNGASEPLLPYEGNDLPGTYAGRGLARLIRTRGVLPGKRAVIVGSTQEALALARLLLTSGARIVGVVDPAGALRATDVRVLAGAAPLRGKGRSRVQGLTVRSAGGKEELLRCDLVGLCGLPAPSIELARQAGAHVAYGADRGGFYVEVEGGRTSAEGVFAAGEVTGLATAAAARDSGGALGALVARTLLPGHGGGAP